jgi:hypothetical protein
MLTYCFVGYIKVANVQNDEHQCIVDDGIEDSSRLVLLVE